MQATFQGPCNHRINDDTTSKGKALHQTGAVIVHPISERGCQQVENKFTLSLTRNASCHQEYLFSVDVRKLAYYVRGARQQRFGRRVVQIADTSQSPLRYQVRCRQRKTTEQVTDRLPANRQAAHKARRSAREKSGTRELRQIIYMATLVQRKATRVEYTSGCVHRV